MFYFFLKLCILPFISRMFVITCTSIYVIVALNCWLHSFNNFFYLIVDLFLFPWILMFLWFFICQIILDYILYILNITLCFSGSYLNVVMQVDIIVSIGNWPVSFRPQVSNCLLWAVISMSVLFSKSLQCFLNLGEVLTCLLYILVLWPENTHF